MKVSNNPKLKVPEKKYMPSIIDEIRRNLENMGVDGLSVDIRYDVRQNVSLVKFSFKGKLYEMTVRNQKDVRANMWAINVRIAYKTRMHLLDIEPFEVSVSPYLQLENKNNIQPENSYIKASSKAYAEFGLPEYASNEEIERTYKKLAKSFHPDMALSEEAKKEFEKRFMEVNRAYQEIKKERGI